MAWSLTTSQDSATVAANTTTEHAAAAQRRIPRKYSPATAGVSLTPAASPTSNPESHHRLLYTASRIINTSTTLIWP